MVLGCNATSYRREAYVARRTIHLLCNAEQVLQSVRLVRVSRGMNTNERAALDGMHTANRLDQFMEPSLAADAWQREYFRVLPELDDLAR